MPGAEEAVELAVQGMTCAACAARIEKNLNRVAGVSASVNFATETAQVCFNPKQNDVGALIEAVRRAGYDAHVQEQGTLVDHGAENRAAFRQFLVAALFTLALLAEMGAMSAGRHGPLLPFWLQLAIASPVQFYSGARSDASNRYARKVIAEHRRLQNAVRGRKSIADHGDSSSTAVPAAAS